MSLDLFKLNGKTALVTGGSKGLGFAMAEAMASAGADIALNSRHGGEARQAAEAIAAKHGRRTMAFEADVTDAAAVERMIGQLNDQWGGVDILVNNAGINIRLPTVEVSLAEWEEVVNVNLTGPFICSKAVAPGMIRKGWGRIIYLSSILGQVGLAGRPAYTASKGALILLTRTQALEFATTGVTVNAICPGPFETPMNKVLLEDPEKYKAFVAKIPMGRWGRMHELNGAILYLASDASSYTTGSVLTVDGGWTAQ